MAQLTDLFPYVMPNVEGCPTAVAKHAIRRAIIELCERTSIYKYALPTVNVVANQDNYVFDIPPGTDIVAPTYVSVNGIQVKATNEEDLDALDYVWRDATSKQPEFYYMDYDNTMYLVPTPSEDIVDGLYVEAALKPTMATESFPDFLYNNWSETIAAGTLMRLHAMIGKVWSDPQTVNMHRGQFKAGISRAKSKTMKSFTRQGKSVQPQSFWD